MRAESIFLPGIFLFILGFGNAVVGQLKTEQFDEILQELQSAEHFREELSRTPLMRLQMAKNLSGNTPSGQRSHFEERRNFYWTVAFGGKVVIALSLALLTLAAYLSWKEGGLGSRLRRKLVILSRR